MEILLAVVFGVVAGVLVKALFIKDSNVAWDLGFGAIGGLAAYYLRTALLTDTVVTYIFTIGTAVLVAGLLHEIWDRMHKTA